MTPSLTAKNQLMTPTPTLSLTAKNLIYKII